MKIFRLKKYFPKSPQIRRRDHLSVFFMICLVFLMGCSTHQPLLPSITDDKQRDRHIGKMVWFDLVTPTPEIVMPFYQSLFGWDITAAPNDYFVIRQNNTAIGGIAVSDHVESHEPGSLWLPSLSVENVTASARFMTEAGGSIIESPADIADRGTLAVVNDPQGAYLVLLRAEGGDTQDVTAKPGDWVWTDLITHDVEKSLDLYRELIGYETTTIRTQNGFIYHFLRKEGKTRAGVLKMPFEEEEAIWVPYVLVEDLEKTLELSSQTGGKLIIRTRDAAILLDPAGAAIGIQEKAGMGGDEI